MQANILSLHTPLTHRVVKRSKLLLLKVVMLQIKLKGKKV